MSDKRVFPFLIFILTISFYIYTLTPSLAWGDGTRLQSEAVSGESLILAEMTGHGFSPDPYVFSKVGVTAWDHPLYIVLGHLLVRMFPGVDSLRLVNLISAVFGAASIALVFDISRRRTNSLPASAYAASALAVSHTFWWHSSTPEVYTLFIFLLLLAFSFYEDFEEKRKVSRLFIAALCLGLAASNHILAFLALPALGLYFLLSRNIDLKGLSWHNIIPPLIGFVLGFSIYLVQFIRITRNFPLNELAGPIIGSTFLSGLSISPLVLGESFMKYLLFLVLQFGPPGILLGLLGLRRDKKIVSFYIVYMLFGVFYRVSDQFAFFLTSHVFFALLMGVGLDHLLHVLDKKPRLVLTSILLPSILLMPPFYRILPTLAGGFGMDDAFLGIPQVGIGVRDGFVYYIDPNKRGDTRPYDFGIETLDNLPQNATVIAEWYTDTDEYFVLRHFTAVEGLRPDVTILGWITVAPASFDPRLVLDVIEVNFPEHPIYLASLSERFYAASALVETYCIVPENNLYRLYPNNRRDLRCLGIESVTE